MKVTYPAIFSQAGFVQKPAQCKNTGGCELEKKAIKKKPKNKPNPNTKDKQIIKKIIIKINKNKERKARNKTPAKKVLPKPQPAREGKRQWYLFLNTKPPISILAQLSTIFPHKNSYFFRLF